MSRLKREEGVRYAYIHAPIRLHDVIKVKFSLERAMKAQRGSRGIALLFL
jgi:hypothetical protein